MIWSELDFHPDTKKLRMFACLFFGMSLLFGGWQILVKDHWLAGAILLGLGSVIQVLGFARPTAVRWLYAGMMAASFPFGWVMSHLLLAIVYFGLFTPLAWIFRLGGRDRLGLRVDTQASTYWKRRPAVSGGGRYLRPF